MTYEQKILPSVLSFANFHLYPLVLLTKLNPESPASIKYKMDRQKLGGKWREGERGKMGREGRRMEGKGKFGRRKFGVECVTPPSRRETGDSSAQNRGPTSRQVSFSKGGVPKGNMGEATCV